MVSRKPIDRRFASNVLPPQITGIAKSTGVSLHYSNCPCVCREILASVLEDGENNVMKSISGRMGKDGICYYLGLLSGAQFCLGQGVNTGGGEEMPGCTGSDGNRDYMTKMFCWLPSVLAALCRKALEAGIEKEYVHNIIRYYGLFPESPIFENDTWPWPVKIYVLGGFELVLDGKPIPFAGKIQRKPLQMLKTLIALGGNEVREEQLTDLLWPDADGDRAHSAFTTTLSRLRRLISCDKAIEVRGGIVSLNPRYCWTDAWAFEEICRQVDSMPEEVSKSWGKANGNSGSVFQLAERAINMYGGPFLSGEENHSWVMPLRERLNGMFHRIVARCGRHLETMEEWGRAAKYYQMALETGEAADEEVYRRLMICHHRLDQPAKVVEAYKRCSRTLADMLGIKPSSKTETIYKDLVLSME